MAKALEVWTPFRGIDRFRRDFDDLVDRFLGGSVGELLPSMPSFSHPAIESFVEDGKLVIRADLPGIDPKDVDVTVSGDTLTLRGKREQKKETKERGYIHREVSYGNFERTITLPAGIKPEEVKASYKDGVLELTMPVPREMTTRKVPIEVDGGSRKQVEKQT